MTNHPAHVKMGAKIAGILILLVGVFLGGISIGYANRPVVQKITGLTHMETAIIPEADFNAFWNAWQIVNEKFPGADKVSTEDKIYGAIKGMLASYKDPYTTFFTPAESKVFESQIAGAFSGVGMELGQKNGVLTVIAPLKDTPADRAGIKSGDKLVKIDNTITTDMTIDKAIDLIRGTEGTSVTLTLIRDGETEPKVITLKRATITLPTVKTIKYDTEGVFVIQLYSFSAQSPELFKNALTEYLSSGSHKLVLDMRGNPGGYLEAAATIGGWFIPEGKVIVKEIGKIPTDITVHTSKGPLLFPSTDKLIILVDGGSASAAEILAGALSEQGIGTLAGEKTFGKGSVQEVVKLTDDTSMKVTVAKWYTPHDVSISDSGLTPKLIVPYTVAKPGVDPQLDAAVKLLR